MPTKVAIQQERDFAGNMTQLMEIMKGLALASYVTLKKEKEKRYETFVNSFNGFFHIADLTKAKNPFVREECETVGMILVTSEESFMSGLNSKIIRMGIKMSDGKPSRFMVLGKKSVGRLKGEGKEFVVFPGIRGKNLYPVAVQVKDYVVKAVKEKKMGPVIGVYADPVSFSTQRAVAVHFLPAHDAYPKEMNETADPNDIIYRESKIETVMEYLSEIWITNKLYNMFQDNKMAEFAAQAMQLEGSLQNLSELNRKLKLQYAKKRGELIDASLREIVSALLVT